MKRLLLIFLILLLASVSAFGTVKHADLAGKWYSSSAEKLRAELLGYLKKASPPEIDGEIIGVISPHAGFAYSGPVAAYGFKAVSKEAPKTVIVVGFNHGAWYDGIAVLDRDAFQTPLGVVDIDREIAAELIKKNAKIYSEEMAFSGENSVEMEIPFLQAALENFKVVLIAIGIQSFENCNILGDALYEVLKDRKNYLLVASTDMSHYLVYDDANSIDGKAISLIKEFDSDKLYAASLAMNHKLMCGYGAVCAAMRAAKKLGADKVEILKYANSGDITGDKSRVVGYVSAAFIKSRAKIGEGNMLNEEQKKKVLKLARNSITHHLKTGKLLPVEESDPVLNKEMGAFVTLHKRGELRGCVGNMQGHGPFYLTVRDMAVEAAVGDMRFFPVRLEEMDDIDIEISMLSPLERIEDPQKIEMGKHGVYVRQGGRSGVYLPQVATEHKLGREEFMNSLCGHKSGIAPDAWKKGECEIYIFTADVFGEKEH